jgi:phospholipase/carboxylesterase
MKLEHREDAIILDPGAAAQASIIWLHGLGADADDFVPIVPELRLPSSAQVRFVFPRAPERTVAVAGGMRLRAWCDVFGFALDDPQDAPGIRASEQAIRRLIAAERSGGIAAEKIVLAGFSQGGSIAVHTALRYPERLGGLLALSTYLPLHEKLVSEQSPANLKLPILMCHGRADTVVPCRIGELSRDQLIAAGHGVDWREFEMGHEVCDAEVELIGGWLRFVLNV